MIESVPGTGIAATNPEPPYQDLFNAAPGLYLVLDPQFRIVAVNDAYTRATMTRREHIVGKHLFEVFPDNPDDPATAGMRNLRASLMRTLQTAQPDTMPVQKYDIRKPAEDGGGFETRYWSPLNTPVLGPDGQPAYIIHRVEDITEFMKLREQGQEDRRLKGELHERARRMEAEVFTRSREVAEASAQLKSANEELERLYARTQELDELKTRFFANVSHELRTPLTLILGPLAQLRRSPGLNDTEQRHAEVMWRNAQLLRRQVDNLLDLAKLDAGQMAVRYSRFDLASLLRVWAAHFETMAEDRHIRYATQTPESLWVEADPEKCARIVLNLLSNAFKFTPDGGSIRITLESGSDRVLLRVADNGPGIPPAMWTSVFERFQQVEDNGQYLSSGTGLGLAIVKEFVLLHQGSVEVGNAPDGGALFTVALPLTAAPGTRLLPFTPAQDSTAVDAIAPMAPTQASAEPVTSPTAAPLVLIVEDNVDMNGFIAASLAEHYRVARAFDGPTGLRLALDLEPDLILSDVMMPGMSGDQLVQAIRRHRELDDTPIVMLTAKADDALRAHLLRYGVQDYVHKPFSTEELLARVAGLLRERRRVHRRLRNMEERFQATFEQAAVGIAHVAPDGRWLRVNNKLCDILGYTHQELLQLTFQELTPPEDLENDFDEINRLLQGEATHYRIEKRYRRKDDNILWAQLTVSLVRDEQEQPDYFIAVIEDITTRRLNDARLRQAAAVFESASEGVIITDLKGHILAVNQACCDITGHRQQDMLGQNARLFRSERHGPEFFQSLWGSLRECGSWQGEIWNRRLNGEIYPGWMTISTVYDEVRQPLQYVALLTDISQIRRSEEQLTHLAHYDPLTDLPNRLLLHSRLEHALDRAKRIQHRVAVLFINLDRFQNINDSLGHPIGDQLLAAVATRLRRRVRGEDSLGRFGGDEFLLILESVTEFDEVAVAAQGILDELSALFELPGGIDLYMGAGIGISVFPDDGDTATDLLRNADIALHQAKAQDHNRFCFYAASMTADAQANLELERALRKALEHNEFLLYYQPKIETHSGRICGAEALIRWQQPGGQLISPARFIPLAEATGLIVPIGTWVTNEVVRQLQAWREAGLDIQHVALNVSARQFSSGNLASMITAALERHQLPGNCLELELTESMLMDDPEKTIATLHELKRLGLHISLDDFGTGYSSFGYLSRFPIDALKIDQSFVRNMATVREAALIAISIIDLAHNLGLKVVAEGIENRGQLAFLSARGCDEMQGYLFSHPLQADAFAALVREGTTFDVD
ncbi:MAG TPA: EAL domain-containing protein [Macromonas sp.]|nr:EAL domain-containing protein [Macromonas sp.]